MQLNRKQRSSAPNDQAANTTTTTVSGRREISVKGGETIIVKPRLSGWYKTMIWFSFLLNAILLLVVIGAGILGWQAWRQYQAITASLAPQVNTQGAVGETVGGVVADVRARDFQQAIDTSFGLTQQKVGDVMGAVQGLQQATIRATIPINQQLPITLQVPVDQDTIVVIQQPVPLTVPATIVFPGGGGNLNATVSLNLPTGLELPVHLNMTIPLTSSVPVKFDVPVTIPLRDTELAKPFADLYELLRPIQELLTPRSQ